MEELNSRAAAAMRGRQQSWRGTDLRVGVEEVHGTVSFGAAVYPRKDGKHITELAGCLLQL